MLPVECYRLASVNYNLYISVAHSTIWGNVTGVSQTANGVDNWLPVYGPDTW